MSPMTKGRKNDNIVSNGEHNNAQQNDSTASSTNIEAQQQQQEEEEADQNPKPREKEQRHSNSRNNKTSISRYSLSWSQTWREYRHSPCLMNPISALLLIAITCLSLVGLILSLPQFVLGILASRLLRRGPWFVEFLYPFSAARWAHFWLMRWGARAKHGKDTGRAAAPGSKDSNKKKNNPPHSRSIEQRTEVVKGRVYVHPIPQLLDNVGYLIVCCPPPLVVSTNTSRPSSPSTPVEFGRTSTRLTSNKEHDIQKAQLRQIPILALLVDCGDADAALSCVEVIRDTHYLGRDLELRAVLSTHKHHDHTAGNRGLMRHKVVGKTIEYIYGGAVEHVPHCNRYVRDGEFLTLPSVEGNDMNEVVEMEVIAVPSHTRGSVVYALRNKPLAVTSAKEQSEKGKNVGRNTVEVATEHVVAHLFTGDAMFSGGGGVPFEADLEFPRDRSTAKKKSNSHIKASAGTNSIERCFSEILVRGLGHSDDVEEQEDDGADACNRMLVYPGHDYTPDLLLRQFDPSSEYSGQWQKLPPAVFFETASHYYVSSHRRTLPSGGRLLTVPSTIRREVRINPHLRSMMKRGEHVCHAVKLWYRHFARGKIQQQLDPEEVAQKLGVVIRPSSSFSTSQEIVCREVDDAEFENSTPLRRSTISPAKTPSTGTTWNMNADDLNRPVFTTVYASDLDDIIDKLQSGSIDPDTAARRLVEMKTKLDVPAVVRRPIPGTIPTEKGVYLGLLALALLGSRPCAMTVSDGHAMNLPCPVDNSDRILVSKTRLIAVLIRLGLVSPRGDNSDLIQMIHLLWKEARFDDHDLGLDAEKEEGTSATGSGETPSEINKKPTDKPNYNSTDVEAPSSDEETNDDEVELGMLKWALYGAAMNQPSWFTKFCLPCRSYDKPKSLPARPNTKMRRSDGELVRHDVTACSLCRGVVGCPVEEDEEECYCDEAVYCGEQSMGKMLGIKSVGNASSGDAAIGATEHGGFELEAVQLGSGVLSEA